MKWFLVVVAVFWIAMGAWGNLYPTQMHAKLRPLIERIMRNRLPITILTLVVGILLILAAPASNQGVGLVRLIGLIAIAKAVIFFLLPADRFQRLWNWWLAPEREQSLRVSGLVMLVLGVVLLSWL